MGSGFESRGAHSNPFLIRGDADREGVFLRLGESAPPARDEPVAVKSQGCPRRGGEVACPETTGRPRRLELARPETTGCPRRAGGGLPLARYDTFQW